MMGNIESVNRSQSGKTLGVKVGDRWYTSKNWELEQKVGHQIVFEPSTSEFNGKTMYWINDYSEPGTAPTTADDAFNAAHAGHMPPQAPQSAPAPQTPQPGTWDRDCSIMAQALTKAVTAPNDDVTKVWSRFMSFYRYAQKGPVDAPKPQQAPVAQHATSQAPPSDFDDSIPF